MSKTDTCLRCGKLGHTSSSCKLPLADHVVEPYDGQEGMVRCTSCQRQGVLSYDKRRGCPSFIPSMAAVLRHCAWFVLIHKRRAHP